SGHGFSRAATGTTNVVIPNDFSREEPAFARSQELRAKSYPCYAIPVVVRLNSGVLMTKALAIALILSTSLFAQTAATKPTTHKAAKPAAAPKEAMPQVTAPTAVIDTTAGRMTCTLFPDKAPNSVANFVGLAD